MRWRLVGRRPVVGLSCRWLDGTVRQQCVGHLPFERQARANGGFSILPTGSIDPEETLAASEAARQVSERSGRSERRLNANSSAKAV